jgi:hypothetical protein
MYSGRRCARSLVPAAMLVMGFGLSAMADPAARDDQRLLFDPATYDQTAGTADRGTSVPAGGAATGAERARKDGKDRAAQRSPSSAAPRYFDGRLPTHGVDRHVLAVPKTSEGGADGSSATNARPSLSVGTFSLGLETDTKYKPRTPLNPDASEMGYDTTYDPRHGVTMPFIGLSATSILP